MPVPKRNLSVVVEICVALTNTLLLRPFSLCKTENCNTPLLGHTVCMGCGMYKGKQIVK